MRSFEFEFQIEMESKPIIARDKMEDGEEVVYFYGLVRESAVRWRARVDSNVCSAYSCYRRLSSHGRLSLLEPGPQLSLSLLTGRSPCCPPCPCVSPPIPSWSGSCLPRCWLALDLLRVIVSHNSSRARSALLAVTLPLPAGEDQAVNNVV